MEVLLNGSNSETFLQKMTMDTSATSLLTPTPSSFSSPAANSNETNCKQATAVPTKAASKKVKTSRTEAKPVLTEMLSKDEVLYCICRRPSDEEEDDMMIECDECKDWLHGK